MRCKSRGCKRKGEIAGYCRKHARKRGDREFSKSIREGRRCAGRGKFWKGPKFPCSRQVDKEGHLILQCAHLISRRYLQTRWSPDNAVPLCAGHHRWLDTHPIEKDMMCESYLGEEKWDQMKKKAMETKGWESGLEKLLKS